MPERRSNYGFQVCGLVIGFAPRAAYSAEIFRYEKNGLIVVAGTIDDVQLDVRITNSAPGC
jgi:hypothetical protein